MNGVNCRCPGPPDQAAPHELVCARCGGARRRHNIGGRWNKRRPESSSSDGRIGCELLKLKKACCLALKQREAKNVRDRKFGKAPRSFCPRPPTTVASLWARQASWIEPRFKSPLGPWSERASSSRATFAMISANCVAGRDQGRGIACAFGTPVHWGCNDSVVADYRRIPSGSRGGERAGGRLGGRL